jgi:hypothetical protein
VNATSDFPKAASSRGDFYVEDGCCTSCGVPQSIAPELVGWTGEKNLPSCYWIRQPESPEEVDRAINIIHAQELGCHRYSGADPAILERLPREECDFFFPERAFRYSRAGGAFWGATELFAQCFAGGGWLVDESLAKSDGTQVSKVNQQHGAAKAFLQGLKPRRTAS